MWPAARRQRKLIIMATINIKPLSRRAVLQIPLMSVGVVILSQSRLASAGTAVPTITVWKTPSCGCCHEWVAHLRKNSLEVVTNDVKDTAPIRQKLGLPAKFGSCHTASLGNYVIEGHVPSQEIKRLLREKPKAIGLAVPGMPVGSPGMEMDGSMTGARDAYNVLLVLHDGSSRIYQSYPSKSPSKS